MLEPNSFLNEGHHDHVKGVLAKYEDKLSVDALRDAEVQKKLTYALEQQLHQWETITSGVQTALDAGLFAQGVPREFVESFSQQLETNSANLDILFKAAEEVSTLVPDESELVDTLSEYQARIRIRIEECHLALKELTERIK